MTATARARRSDRSIGVLLQHWRRTRRLSQLGLATEAGISARHLCFVETGRASPSRDMVVRLANVLDVPLRERNALLLAAGFAPLYLESSMDAPELGAVRTALDAILRQQEPFPAVVMNRHWDILRTNVAAGRFFGHLLGDAAGSAPPNVLRMMFHPRALKPYVTNWEAVADGLLRRVQREAVGGVRDAATLALLAEILAYPGVPSVLRNPDPTAALLPVLPVSFAKGRQAFHFFSAVTTLGTPQDITVQEIRIECFFPADEATAEAARKLIATAKRARTTGV